MTTLTRPRIYSAVALVLLVLEYGCSKNNNVATPSPQTTPPVTNAPPPTYTLTGTVRESATVVIPNATVTVVDGPNGGKFATTNGAGVYTITGLTFAGFSVSVTATN